MKFRFEKQRTIQLSPRHIGSIVGFEGSVWIYAAQDLKHGNGPHLINLTTGQMKRLELNEQPIVQLLDTELVIYNKVEGEE